jgi:D-beta-D-heptose 7-phosphate kinase/D-beta-D-heptose 1-phosphate adenosyltransferase
MLLTQKKSTNIIVNGTFDILHVGHLKLLEYAKSLGDHLTVAIDTDRRIKTKKGQSRPINNEYERKTMLEHLKSVDQVVIFDSDEELIDLVKNSDIMVKGSDYKGKSVIGETYCKKVIYYDRIEGYSTTQKIQSIVDR